jgi:hypothetical protein
MKKNNVILATAAVFAICLFYQQLTGLNFLVFSVFYVTSLLVLDPTRLRNPRWCIYAGCVIAASAAVFIINSDLSIFTSIVTLIILSGITFHPVNSVFTAGFFSALSLVTAPARWLMDVMENKPTAETPRWRSAKTVVSVLIAVVSALVFFGLYRLSNPLFHAYAASIDLSFFKMDLALVGLAGLLIMYGLTRPLTIPFVTSKDLTAQADIEAGDQHGRYDSNTLIPAILFLLLNCMLLVMNGLDIDNIYISCKLPVGINLSDFVHQAVAATVFSILMAVGLIAWFYSGSNNFTPTGKKVRVIIYLWIAQTVLLVVNTMVRNYWYIREYALTHQRIGVYIFLVLCLTGLSVTWLKLARHHSAWRLATINIRLWFFMLVVFSLINWDRVITRYNIGHTPIGQLDVEYLTALSDANLPELAALLETGKLNGEEQQMILKKARRIERERRFYVQWPSWNLRWEKNKKVIEQMPVGTK